MEETVATPPDAPKALDDIMQDIHSRDIIRVIGGRALVFRRWGWVTATKVMPTVIDLLSSLMKVLGPEQIQGAITAEDAWKIFQNSNTMQLAGKVDLINTIIVQTLLAAPKNFATVDEAQQFLARLELDEGLAVAKIIFLHNTENVRKNLFGLGASPTKI